MIYNSPLANYQSYLKMQRRRKLREIALNVAAFSFVFSLGFTTHLLFF